MTDERHGDDWDYEWHECADFGDGYCGECLSFLGDDGEDTETTVQ